MARPRTKLPRGSRDILTALAHSGNLKETQAAANLGLSLTEFRRLIRDNEDAKELWDELLAIERDQLLEKMGELAKEGDRQAVAFLLAARHGMSEKSPSGAQPGVQISFNLPQALSPEQYAKAIQGTEIKAIDHDQP